MFEITAPTEAFLKTVTPRTEKHGEDDVFAISLGLKLLGSNTLLDLVLPGLRETLYKAVAEGQDPLPGVEKTLPLLRCKGIASLDLAAKFEGWTLKIDAGVDENDPIALGGARVDKFVVVPHEGGSIELHFRVGSNDIDAEEAGWICAHLRQTITITLTAPVKAAEGGQTIDGTQAAFLRDHPNAGKADLLDGAGGGPREGDGASDGEGSDTDANPALDATDAFLAEHGNSGAGGSDGAPGARGDEQRGENWPFPRKEAGADGDASAAGADQAEDEASSSGEPASEPAAPKKPARKRTSRAAAAAVE